jgi:adenine-specific DNA-methyltransferase
MGVDLLECVEFFRLDANRRLQKSRRPEWGQFLTSAPVARLLASLIEGEQETIRILDAGAGVGTLSTAAVAELCQRKIRPKKIHVTAYEIDAELATFLPDTFSLCQRVCEGIGVEYSSEIVIGDFLAAVSDHGSLFDDVPTFNCTILNPPYKKINNSSDARLTLRRMGIETTNIYTGFLAAAVQLLEAGGELAAITPRSFCNGSYFRRFRKSFLANMHIDTIHVFESRQTAFEEDEVLQENVVLHAIKRGSRPRSGKITIVSSAGPDDELPLLREVDYSEVAKPGDEAFIHIPADEVSDWVLNRLSAFTASLGDLGLAVSTGRVVDFRAKEHLRHQAEKDTVPLIWPTHFERGYICWPKAGYKKPESIAEAVNGQLVPNEPYVLVRRFSAKEEKRRVVAAVYDPDRIPGKQVGFENHLNYYHRNGAGIGLTLARGLAIFLNSTLVDAYFRQFNGHTQVNATDLRSLKYPTEEQLLLLGSAVGNEFPTQAEIDALLAKELNMPDGIDPVEVKQKTDEALAILKALGFPRQQLNERSALTLLALLGLKPEMPWSAATEPLCGITPMMDFFRDHYGKTYKPNTRETVRRQTVHQFIDAGLILINPDNPDRPVNSPKAVYQIETSALKLLRTYGKDRWIKNLATYLSSVQTLKTKYAQERQMARLPVSLAPGKEITLSPGGQNVLVKEIIDQFAPRFTSPGKFIYVGDTDEKFAYFDEGSLSELGVELDGHGKMPDVIIHYTGKNWLVLIEAVTSHGPIDPKRKEELTKLFKGSTAWLVYVTTFLTRKAMVEYIDQISWETEVWVAESPSHMIHFNGKRFLGPYPS